MSDKTPSVAPTSDKKPEPAKKPTAEVGDTVLWYPDGDTKLKPSVGIVVGTGASLAINLVSAENMNLAHRDGVPHVSDPRAGSEHMKDEGAWDYSPLARRVMALEAAVLS